MVYMPICTILLRGSMLCTHRALQNQRTVMSTNGKEHQRCCAPCCDCSRFRAGTSCIGAVVTVVEKKVNTFRTFYRQAAPSTHKHFCTMNFFGGGFPGGGLS